MPDVESGNYEVEAILDDDLPLSTNANRAQRRFLVNWKGYEKPIWKPMLKLSCGGLLLDYLRL